jgi:hypothetical protein
VKVAVVGVGVGVVVEVYQFLIIVLNGTIVYTIYSRFEKEK